MVLDYLIIGHVTRDIVRDGYRLGGTGAYSAVTAQRLGMRVALVTRAGPELDLERRLPGIMVHNRQDTCTTTFENRYHDGQRTQWVRQLAAPLAYDDVPEEWRQALIVHLAPVAREVPLRMGRWFPGALVGATPQGWLRRWEDNGRVRFRRLPNAQDALRGIEVLVFSGEDVAYDRRAMEALIEAVPIVVVTKAAEGCDVYWQGERHSLPARPVASVVDSTGAGDVFAAAFLIRYRETRDPYVAGQFANVVASFSVEDVGVEALPTRETVESWLYDTNIIQR